MSYNQISACRIIYNDTIARAMVRIVVGVTNANHTISMIIHILR